MIRIIIFLFLLTGMVQAEEFFYNTGDPSMDDFKNSNRSVTQGQFVSENGCSICKAAETVNNVWNTAFTNEQSRMLGTPKSIFNGLLPPAETMLKGSSKGVDNH